MLYLGWLIICAGVIFIILGTFALFRFPDFYTKLHAASVIECCGTPLALIGLAIIQDNFINSFKLCFITVLIMILNPVSTHAISRASLLYKLDQKSRVK